ncbi:MAG: bacillithiol biosynthesis deacetylase BshB1 [Chitinophagaceae bacterium]|nr:bacillithiol biosynthesis deacetylase BshB1 [Chitinophagaceae bacterium]
MKLDIVAFGVHPDDVELSCCGTLLVEKMKGKKVGIVDFTQGELGTRGTPEIRRNEAMDAAEIMQVDIRENLEMADGFFKNDEEHQRKVISILRKYQPEIILCNAPADRHPDHGRAAKLVYTAAFLSGLAKIKTKEKSSLQKAWRPKYVFNYIQDRYFHPDFVVDITAVFEKKIEAIQAYRSQFYNPESNEPDTYISSPEFLESIIYRAKMFGKLIGVKYAEGFISKKMIGIQSFDALIQKDT